MKLTGRKNRMHNMLRIYTFVSITLWIICQVMPVKANTLDDTIKQSQTVVENMESVDNMTENSVYVESEVIYKGYEDIYTSTASPVVEHVNSKIGAVVKLVIQILSYAIVSFMVLRIMLDLLYIAIPFSRSLLGGGVVENTPVQTNTMGSFGIGQPTGGFEGMAGPVGMGNSGQMSINRTKWVSENAIRAVGASYNGENPYKIYVKDMTILLIITPILMVLAISGVLTNLGFILGEVLIEGIESIKNMI